jgi:Fur family ferric uptake transcriptional regulator
MRVTKPRIAILNSLLQRQAPASIEQIHEDIDRESCDLVTVYRCLAAFESIGLVRRSFLHNGTSLYELSAGQPQHYHIVCKSCGKAERVDYFSVEGMERLLRDRGYTDITHLVEFFGVCPACQTTAPARQIAPTFKEAQT